MTLGTDDIRHHISDQFNQDLLNIHQRVLEMGRLVNVQIATAVAALENNDADLAQSVRNRDPAIDALEVQIDEECSHVLVRRQPAAGDLRFIFAVIKMTTDLERAGDQAERVARTVLEQTGETQAPLHLPIGHIGSLVMALWNKALDAFDRMDIATALEVARDDKMVDQEYKAIMRQLVTYMMEDPRTIGRALHLAWAARAVERIGDHAKNIAEYVIYMVQGKDVRHMSISERERSVDLRGAPAPE